MSLSDNSSDIKITRSKISPITRDALHYEEILISQGEGVKRSKPFLRIFLLWNNHFL